MPQFSIPTQAGFALLIGLLCGAAYFLSLHWTVRWIGAGGFAKAAAIQLARLGLLTLLFIALAKVGAVALLAAAAGLLLARQLVLHQVRRLS